MDAVVVAEEKKWLLFDPSCFFATRSLPPWLLVGNFVLVNWGRVRRKTQAERCQRNVVIMMMMRMMGHME